VFPPRVILGITAALPSSPGPALAGTLCGVEMGLALCGVPVVRSGVAAALDHLEAAARSDVAPVLDRA
jgi:hypothetical protein